MPGTGQYEHTRDEDADGEKRSYRGVAVDTRESSGERKDDQRCRHRGDDQRENRAEPPMEPPAKHHDVREHDSAGGEPRYRDEHPMISGVNPAAGRESPTQQLD